MKIFAITGNVILTQKPEWLDTFREKYDKPYEYHVTLKQPCFIQESEFAGMKTKLDSIFESRSYSTIDLTFNSIKIDTKDPLDICIMINSPMGGAIHALQNLIVAELSTYKNYCKPESADWEQNFQPHITIARDLNAIQLEQAKQDLKDDLACTGMVSEVVLFCVDNLNPAEAKKPENQTIYKL